MLVLLLRCISNVLRHLSASAEPPATILTLVAVTSSKAPVQSMTERFALFGLWDLSVGLGVQSIIWKNR